MSLTHFGAIANGGPSHVQSVCAIGRELQRRGHRFTLFGTASQVQRAAQLNIPVHQLGSSDPWVNYGDAVRTRPRAFMGSALQYMKEMTGLLCKEAPRAFEERGIGVLLADQEEPGAATAADLAKIPYVTICSSIPLNEDIWIPPSFVEWGASPDRLTRLKNFLVYRTRNLAVAGVSSVANWYRKRAGLNLYRSPDDSFSKLAHISQLVREFDFSRKTLPPNFNYVGPFQRGSLRSAPFPYERLDGRPTVYASLGTIQGVRTDILLMIAQVCQKLPVQLVLSLGGVEINEEHLRFPGDPIVVQYAPQTEILARSAAVIAHAGLNTTMEALAAGVPIIVIPTNWGDQSGVAARVRHHGVGRVLDGKLLNGEYLHRAVLALLNSPNYRQAAGRMKKAIDGTGGAAQAAGIVECFA